MFSGMKIQTWSYLYKNVTNPDERSKTRQTKFESILEIIESVVFSTFVKAEADLLF
jgi:hypothetical protein